MACEEGIFAEHPAFVDGSHFLEGRTLKFYRNSGMKPLLEDSEYAWDSGPNTRDLLLIKIAFG